MFNLVFWERSHLRVQQQARQRSKKQCEPLWVFLKLAPAAQNKPLKLVARSERWPKVQFSRTAPSSFLPAALPGRHKIIKRGAEKFIRHGLLLNVFSSSLWYIWSTIWSTKLRESTTEKKPRSYGHFPYEGVGGYIPFHSFWGCFS